MQNGDGGEFAHFLREPDGKWRNFAGFTDKLVQATFGPDGDLFVVSRQDAPRGKILRLSVKDLSARSAREVIPEGNDAIVTDFWSKPTVLPTASRLYVTYQLGGPTEVRVFDLDGKADRRPKQLPDLHRRRSDAAGRRRYPLRQRLVSSSRSASISSRRAPSQTVKPPLTTPSSVQLDDVTVVREFATSKDGTKVPVNILLPKGTKRDGKNPCIATGYGGYGVNIEPAFRPQLRVLFDHGFIFAQANLRGGGEYGEAWHRAGNLTRKQNVFDDFAAVLKHLIDRKYTSPAQLGIEGGSNGGLLMGAMITQHPELMKAVVSHVGIYDMLRVELSPNGAFNVPEFGTVKDRIAVQGHVRLLALPSRQGRHEISRLCCSSPAPTTRASIRCNRAR